MFNWSFDKDYWNKIKTYMIIRELHMVIFIIWGLGKIFSSPNTKHQTPNNNF